MSRETRRAFRKGAWIAETVWAAEWLEEHPDEIKRSDFRTILADTIPPGRAVRAWWRDYESRMRVRETTHPELTEPLPVPNDDVKILRGAARVANQVISDLINKGLVVQEVRGEDNWLIPTDPPEPEEAPALEESPAVDEVPDAEATEEQPEEDTVTATDVVHVLEDVLPDVVAVERPSLPPPGSGVGTSFWVAQGPQGNPEIAQLWRAVQLLDRELSRTKAIAVAKRLVVPVAPPKESPQGWKLTEVYDKRMEALEAENAALRERLDTLVEEVLTPKCGWSWVLGQGEPTPAPCGKLAEYRMVTKFRANLGVVDVCWEHSQEAALRGMFVQPLLFEVRGMLLPSETTYRSKGEVPPPAGMSP